MLFELPRDVFIKGVKFKKLSLEDKDVFDSYLNKTAIDMRIYFMNFTYTIGYSAYGGRSVLYKIIDDMFCVFVYKNEILSMLYLPFGTNDRKKIII